MGDIRRISEYYGRDDFFEFRKPRTEEYIDQADDPNWNSYTLKPGGYRRVLKQGLNGFCHFLSGDGCGLTPAVRPLVCRIHPVEFTEGRITGIASECPTELLAPGETLLENLRMSEAEVEQLRTQLYDELRDEWMTILPKAA